MSIVFHVVGYDGANWMKISTHKSKHVATIRASKAWLSCEWEEIKVYSRTVTEETIMNLREGDA